MAPIDGFNLECHQYYLSNFENVICSNCNENFYCKSLNYKNHYLLDYHYKKTRNEMAIFLMCAYTFDDDCDFRILSKDIMEQIINFLPDDVCYNSKKKNIIENSCTIL